MPLRTLCGIFDEPPKTPKKNFIKENIKSIKQLQGLLQEAQRKSRENSKSSIERNQSSRGSRERISSAERIQSNSRQDLQASRKENCTSSKSGQSSNVRTIDKTLSAIDKMQNINKQKGYKAKKYNTPPACKPQCSDRSVQTDFDFESCDKWKPQPKEQVKATIKPKERHESEIKKDELCLEGGFHPINPTIEDELASKKIVLEPQLLPGHTLLPEVERVETLNKLKENYQKLIYELNGLSLTCDTLRIKRRRIQIEEDLKKIDDAINIFDRARVYVKE